MTKTYREIFEFQGAANDYLAKREAKSSAADSEAGASKPGETKFTYALRRAIKKCQRAVDEYQDQLQEINIRHCAEDKDGIIMTENGGQLRFSREGMLAAQKERRALVDKKVSVENYMAQGEIPRDLTEDQIEAFTGFVLPEKKK